MATRSSNLEDWTSGANLQMEGHMDMPSQGQKDPKETGALDSSPSHSPSCSLARRLPPNCPNTRYCLGIHVTLTKETGPVPPPSHAQTAPLVEDMLCYAMPEQVSPMQWLWAQVGQSFFMGDDHWERALVWVSLGMLHSCLQGWALWFGKPAYLATDPLTIQEGRWENCQPHNTMLDKGERSRASTCQSVDPQPFRLNHPGDSPQKDTTGDANSDHQLLPC